jgi:hypothetical protein
MLSAGLLVVMMAAAPVQDLMIPEGTILPVVLNETLNTAKVQENDPILFTLAEDIRAAGRRGPVLLPRGSSVVGRIVMTDRAGHLVGRSAMDIRLQQIITPNGEVYDGVSTKIIDMTKKKGQKAVVKADGGLQGPGHAKRDTFFLLFPPTTGVSASRDAQARPGHRAAHRDSTTGQAHVSDLRRDANESHRRASARSHAGPRCGPSATSVACSTTGCFDPVARKRQ